MNGVRRLKLHSKLNGSESVSWMITPNNPFVPNPYRVSPRKPFFVSVNSDSMLPRAWPTFPEMAIRAGLSQGA